MDCKEIRTEAEVSGSRGYLLAKRLQDILLSGLALVALSREAVADRALVAGE